MQGLGLVRARTAVELALCGPQRDDPLHLRAPLGRCQVRRRRVPPCRKVRRIHVRVPHPAPVAHRIRGVVGRLEVFRPVRRPAEPARRRVGGQRGEAVRADVLLGTLHVRRAGPKVRRVPEALRAVARENWKVQVGRAGLSWGAGVAVWRTVTVILRLWACSMNVIHSASPPMLGLTAL